MSRIQRWTAPSAAQTQGLVRCVNRGIRALPVVLVCGLSQLQNQRVPRLELYPFKYRDRITGKWVRARHKLQVPALQRQYAEWEITSAPEIRHVTPGPIEHFNPFRSSGAYDASPGYGCRFPDLPGNTDRKPQRVRDGRES